MIHLSIYINRHPDEVYRYVSTPYNLPEWAAGLTTSSIRPEGNAWVAQAPFGRVSITFTEANRLGVLDHAVELESGQVVYNAMRVIPNNEGSELIFSLVRQPGMTDEQFNNDKLAVETDLKTLKRILEANKPNG